MAAHLFAQKPLSSIPLAQDGDGAENTSSAGADGFVVQLTGGIRGLVIALREGGIAVCYPAPADVGGLQFGVVKADMVTFSKVENAPQRLSVEPLVGFVYGVYQFSPGRKEKVTLLVPVFSQLSQSIAHQNRLVGV